MRYRSESIGKIEPGNTALSPRASRVRYSSLESKVVFTAAVDRNETLLIDADSITAGCPLFKNFANIEE